MLFFVFNSLSSFERDEEERQLAFPNLRTVNLRKTWIRYISLLSCFNAYPLFWFEIGLIYWLLQCEGIKGKQTAFCSMQNNKTTQ